jgi:hypothetical protein
LSEAFWCLSQPDEIQIIKLALAHKMIFAILPILLNLSFCVNKKNEQLRPVKKR